MTLKQKCVLAWPFAVLPLNGMLWWVLDLVYYLLNKNSLDYPWLMLYIYCYASLVITLKLMPYSLFYLACVAPLFVKSCKFWLLKPCPRSWFFTILVGWGLLGDPALRFGDMIIRHFHWN